MLQSYSRKSRVLSGLVFSGILMAIAVPAAAGTYASDTQDYVLEYTTMNASGSAVAVGDYSIVSQVQTKGVAGQTASSESYSISPLIGSSAPAAESAVVGWSLYY